ncbi:MAG TPA: matrixin family metalloprotease, partial [Marmoricola sp.]|nr:matrixin family metalloprotease [Marmoricola sp.]
DRPVGDVPTCRRAAEDVGDPAATHVRTDGRGGHLVSGVVAVDADDLGGTGRDAGRLRLRMLLLHELGHLVGLGHVENPHLVMHEYVVPASDEAPAHRYGDRLGLAAAGSGPC